ncbi:MAG: hypothetical protein AUJ97_05170 [Bacteroidetes bacterium CG2_30_32_10]|nr:MAG: hypothetical protein AUJ97_05170 [Bacteroidetes bacterium CG2_30_32_10]
MKLSRIFQILVPKDTKFFELFEKDVENLVVGAALFVKLVNENDTALQVETIKKIKEIENIGDDITHNIFKELNQTFITPFDREDINQLAATLDDVLDCINGSAQRIKMFKPHHLIPEFGKIAELIYDACNELKVAIKELKNLKHPEKITESCIRVNYIENQVDEMYHTAISSLFETQTNAIELIKLKEIAATMEKATDKAEDVSDVIKTIIIKNA